MVGRGPVGAPRRGRRMIQGRTGRAPGAGTPAFRAPTGAVQHDAAVRQRRRGLLAADDGANGQLRLQAAQHGKDIFVFRLLIDIVNVGIADKAKFIHNKDGALRGTIRAQHTVSFRNSAVRPEVAQQRVVDSAQALSPRLQAGDMVNTQAQNLGIQSREQSILGFVRRDLPGSYGRPGQRKEHQHHVFSAQAA